MIPIAIWTVLTGLLGLAVGSFLNVVIHRVPARESVVHPPSRCPRCGHAIRPWHNVPVLGWLLLRGRCADCRSPISVRYPLVELGTGLLFALLTVRVDAAAVPAYLFLAALGVALAMIDLDHHRLPNTLVLPAYPVLGVLLGLASALTGDWTALLHALIGGAAAFAAFYAMAFAYPGGMGFGDVKLAGVLGAALAYLSWSALIIGLFGGFVLGALVGVAVMVARRGGRRTALPFGPFMLIGALLGILFGSHLGQLYLDALAR